MPTGYEIDMYRDIARIRTALERIADAEERVATALEYQTYGQRDGVATRAKRLAARRSLPAIPVRPTD
jgi:hypothetical protein